MHHQCGSMCRYVLSNDLEPEGQCSRVVAQQATVVWQRMRHSHSHSINVTTQTQFGHMSQNFQSHNLGS
jgi:hypothetical protein